MRWTLLTVAALAALALPLAASAEERIRPLDRIYAPRPGEAPVPRSGVSRGEAPRTMGSAAPQTRPLDRRHGSSVQAPRSSELGTAGGSAPKGAAGTRARTNASRKAAGPTYRGGIVGGGTRPRAYGSPSLSGPRR